MSLIGNNTDFQDLLGQSASSLLVEAEDVTIDDSLTLDYSTPNTNLVVNANKKVVSEAKTTLSGSDADQITIVQTGQDWALSLPQDINITSDVEFNRVTTIDPLCLKTDNQYYMKLGPVIGGTAFTEDRTLTLGLDNGNRKLAMQGDVTFNNTSTIFIDQSLLTTSDVLFNRVTVPNGSISAPSLTVDISTKCGWYSSGDYNMSFAVNNSNPFQFSTGAMRPMINNGYSIGTSTYQFAGGYFNTIIAETSVETGELYVTTETDENPTLLLSNNLDGFSSTGDSIYFYTGSVSRITMGGSAFRPTVNHVFECGATNFRWSNMHTDLLTVTDDITVGGTVDGRNVSADGETLDTLDLKINQSLLTTDAVQFADLNITTASTTGATFRLSDSDTGMSGSGNGLYFYIGSTFARVVLGTTSFRPGQTTNTMTLGNTTYRWLQSWIDKMYADSVTCTTGTGTIIMNGSGIPQNTTNLGMKVALHSTTFGLGIQQSMLEIIGANVNTDYRIGYGVSGSLTEVARFDGGEKKLYVDYVRTSVGTASLPSIAMNDVNTGFYGGSNQVNITCDGVRKYIFTSSTFAPATTNVTDLGTSGLSFDLAFINRIRVGNGSVSAPSITFQSDTNLGFYRIGADDMGIVTAGVPRGEISNASLKPFYDHGNSNSWDLGTSTRRWDKVYMWEVHYNSLDLISDSRQKNSVTNLVHGLNAVDQLRPVRFKYNDPCSEVDESGNPMTCDKYDRVHYGFIAQEVEEVLGLVNSIEGPCKYDAEEDLHSMDPTQMIPILTKAIQELSQLVKDQRIEIDLLKSLVIV